MRRETVATVIFISAFLISLIAGVQVVEMAKASGNPWVARTSLPIAISGLEAVAANGKIYAFKGSITYENNPAGGMWTAKSAMPTPRTDVAAATYQNKIYVIGGRTNDSSKTGTNQVYDPANDSWTTLTPMFTPRYGLDANVVEGKVYLAGGLVSHHLYPDDKTTSEATNVNEVYNPATDSWTTKTPMPNAVHFYASTVVNNKIYFISETLTQIYNPENDSWSYGASPPYRVDMAGCAATTDEIAPQRIYVVGGRESGLEVDYNQIYDPAADSWRFGTPMPTARYSLGVAAVNDAIYALGGMTGAFVVTEQKSQVEQYNPIEDITKPAPTPSPSLSPSPSSSPSPSPISSPSPSIPEFPTWISLPLVLVTTLLMFAFIKKSNKKLWKIVPFSF